MKEQPATIEAATEKTTSLPLNVMSLPFSRTFPNSESKTQREAYPPIARKTMVMMIEAMISTGLFLSRLPYRINIIL